MSEEIEYQSLEYRLKTAYQQPGVVATMLIVIKEDEDGDLNYWYDKAVEDDDAEDLMIGMVAGHMDTMIQKKSADISIDFECDIDEFLGEGWEEGEPWQEGE